MALNGAPSPCPGPGLDTPPVPLFAALGCGGGEKALTNALSWGASGMFGAGGIGGLTGCGTVTVGTGT